VNRGAAPAMDATLDAFQRDFAAALRGEAPGVDSPVARLAAQPGFAVYRNTVAAACIDALCANHPTVVRVVGAAWFRDAAAAFARATPPSSGSLAGYGAGFAAFLAGTDAAAELPYLVDVARLDRLWTEAHLAADHDPLDASAVGALAPERLAAARLVPHPAARWTFCADVPAFTIWRRHRDGGDLAAPLDWQGEGALLVRPAGVVAWQPLDAAGVAFLDACAAGLPFGDAAATAGDAVVSLLPRLLAAGAFADIQP